MTYRELVVLFLSELTNRVLPLILSGHRTLHELRLGWEMSSDPLYFLAFQVFMILSFHAPEVHMIFLVPFLLMV